MRSAPFRASRQAKRLAILACGIVLVAPAQKKKDVTQTLQLPRDLPSTVEGDPRRFTFYVTPLTGKGLLTKQVHEALTALSHEAGGATILKIRAFAAGSGDVRRVRDLVSEFYSDRRQPLPTLSLVQSGGLPMEGAQVVLEATAAGKKDVNPNGLVLIAAQTVTSPDPLDPVAPLAAKSIDAMKTALRAAGSEAADVVKVTCFLSSLTGLDDTRKLVASEFHAVAANFVQTQRSTGRALAACEGTARLRRDAGGSVVFLNPEGLPKEAGQSQVALVGAHSVVLSASQVSFGMELKDARLALERLQKLLEPAGASAKQAVFASYFVLGTGIADQIRRVRGDFFSTDRPPAVSLVLMEGLPSLDAGFAVDVVAAK
jgi:enamine deaminase RidA (YjgF/YER057c/UK114 family)